MKHSVCALVLLSLMAVITLEAVVLSARVSTSYCKFHKQCYKDSDCGDQGRCAGHSVGRCNCEGCVNYVSCTADFACGGLNAGCNPDTKECDCISGFKSNGFVVFTDAVTKLCRKECDDKTEASVCFGLGCRPGKCVCGHYFERNE